MMKNNKLKVNKTKKKLYAKFRLHLMISKLALDENLTLLLGGKSLGEILLRDQEIYSRILTHLLENKNRMERKRVVDLINRSKTTSKTRSRTSQHPLKIDKISKLCINHQSKIKKEIKINFKNRRKTIMVWKKQKIKYKCTSVERRDSLRKIKISSLNRLYLIKW